MYEKLVKRLRERAAWINFPHHGEECPTEDAMLMMQAADAIEELQKLTGAQLDTIKQYQAYLNKFSWIPVAERLPEEDKLVLVWRNNGLPYVSRRIDLSYWVGLGRDAVVTHWMPLPQPPKEET